MNSKRRRHYRLSGIRPSCGLQSCPCDGLETKGLRSCYDCKDRRSDRTSRPPLSLGNLGQTALSVFRNRDTISPVKDSHLSTTTGCLVPQFAAFARGGRLGLLVMRLAFGFQPEPPRNPITRP